VPSGTANQAPQRSARDPSAGIYCRGWVVTEVRSRITPRFNCRRLTQRRATARLLFALEGIEL
jgi:hypothetical protein